MGPKAKYLPLEEQSKRLLRLVPDPNSRGGVLFVVQFLKHAGQTTDVDNLVLTIAMVCAEVNIGIKLESFNKLIEALVGKCATGEMALQMFQTNPILQKIISTSFRLQNGGQSAGRKPRNGRRDD